MKIDRLDFFAAHAMQTLVERPIDDLANQRTRETIAAEAYAMAYDMERMRERVDRYIATKAKKTSQPVASGDIFTTLGAVKP